MYIYQLSSDEDRCIHKVKKNVPPGALLLAISLYDENTFILQ